jgi:DNA repair photolyase
MRNQNLKIYECSMKVGITSTPAFEEKYLATHAVNPGTKCDNDCGYCYTSSLPIRMHKSFKQHGLKPSDSGYALIDPDTPDRVAKDARKFRENGVVQLCTYTDAWSPAARHYDMGRRLLMAILENNTELHIRILTKNAEVMDDFDVIEQYKDRVMVGLSLTATASKSDIMQVVEPNTSLNCLRMTALKKAHEMGLRTYGMLCPLLPGISDSREDIDELVKFCEEIGAEDIFSEALNARGGSMKRTQLLLAENGYSKEAEAVRVVTKNSEWSKYAYELIKNIQDSVRQHSDINKLRFLLYPTNLTPDHREQIESDDAGIVWL